MPSSWSSSSTGGAGSGAGAASSSGDDDGGSGDGAESGAAESGDGAGSGDGSDSSGGDSWSRRISSLEEVQDGGYGVGSAATFEDDAQPLGHPIQAWEDTKTYVAPGHPAYDTAEPHVWFLDEAAAERQHQAAGKQQHPPHRRLRRRRQARRPQRDHGGREPLTRLFARTQRSDGEGGDALLDRVFGGRLLDGLDPCRPHQPLGHAARGRNGLEQPSVALYEEGVGCHRVEFRPGDGGQLQGDLPAMIRRATAVLRT